MLVTDHQCSQVDENAPRSITSSDSTVTGNAVGIPYGRVSNDKFLLSMLVSKRSSFGGQVHGPPGCLFAVVTWYVKGGP